ncbi:hypothetical protein B7H23_04220 [Notoacmeibacter marinus]|uniref:MOSC domain-containing protein n=1 Tax=Notoacmeibacter marinus TaxID=1876515 RepID=A0A231V3K0_9HYPH|nr:DsbA family protein [Notoacmeibacter marinus]OXT02136.1 hypothetical protein B7H23_04220 [Notoacmeibacter marinus]
MSQAVIEYYFWPSSDWSFLGHRRLRDLARRLNATVAYKPVRSGSLLQATGGLPLMQRSQQRQAYRMVELERWAQALGSDLIPQPQHFPVDNENALRLLAGAILQNHDIGDLAEAVMRALWIEDRNIADMATLQDIASMFKYSGEQVQHWIGSAESGSLIDDNTQAAIEAGVFGAPSYVVEGEIFWGQDRLPQLEKRLASDRATDDTSLTWRGRLEGIYIAEAAGVEMETLSSARLVEGVGLEGDRYALGNGYYSGKPHPDRQVTLIEQETLEAIERDHGITIEPHETRRNLVTVGVPLNHLVGKRFRVGSVELYGGRLNVPCKYLERLLDRPVFDPLINRSGLNCQIVKGGTIARGDTIAPLF